MNYINLFVYGRNIVSGLKVIKECLLEIQDYCRINTNIKNKLIINYRKITRYIFTVCNN